MWYVAVNAQSYGPYTEPQMQGFAAEGRITAASLIGQNPNNGFMPAGQFPAFRNWMQAVRPAQSPAQPIAQVQPEPQPILRPIAAPQAGVLARQIQPQYSPQPLAPSPQPAPAPSAIQTPATQAIPQPVAAPQNALNTVFVVMAEIRSANGMDFLQALQSLGIAQRIGDSVWLLKSAISAEQLRNQLSQTLDADDRLFILDSFANKTAWFNIGADMDARIRDLWDIQR